MNTTTRTYSCHCGKPATIRIYGSYRNGREATDYRCDYHKPYSERDLAGTWAFFGSTAKMFKVEDIEKLR